MYKQIKEQTAFVVNGGKSVNFVIIVINKPLLMKILNSNKFTKEEL